MNFVHTRIYRVAVGVTAEAQAVCAGMPAGYGYLAEQLRRAAASVVLNFAEGCGKITVRDRRKFFVTAAASANEVIAALDVGVALGVVPTANADVVRDQCWHVASMLARYR